MSSSSSYQSTGLPPVTTREALESGKQHKNVMPLNSSTTFIASGNTLRDNQCKLQVHPNICRNRQNHESCHASMVYISPNDMVDGMRSWRSFDQREILIQSTHGVVFQHLVQGGGGHGISREISISLTWLLLIERHSFQ